MKKEDKRIFVICGVAILILIVLIVYENVKDKDKPIQTETTLTTQYNNNQEYQIFEDYQFKVKCPAILKDVSNQSNDDFDFNYAGSTDDTFYQIMIVKIPAGRLDLTREEEKEFLINMFASKGGGKSVLWGYDNYPAYLLNDYTQDGYKGRGIAVAREGKIYAFNVITKADLDATFNNFTNNVKFIDNKEVHEANTYNNDIAQDKQLPEGYLWGKSKVHIPKNNIEKNIISQITTYNLALFRGDFDNAIEYLYSDATEYFKPFYPEYYSDGDIIKEFYKAFTDSVFNLVKSYEHNGLELDFIVSEIKRTVEEDDAILCVLDISVQTYYSEAKGEKYFHSIPNEDVVGVSLNSGKDWKFISMNEDTPNILRLRFSNDVISNIMNY